MPAEIPGFVEVIDLNLLGAEALLRSIQLQENSARHRGQDRDHNQQFNEGEPAFPVFAFDETLCHN